MPVVELRNIMYKFAQYVLDDDKGSSTGYPNYDGFYRYIEKQMNKYGISEPALVSWLTSEQRTFAINELEHNPALHISRITKPVPRTLDSYPNVNIRYFHEKYHRGDSSFSVSDIANKLNRLDTFGP